MQWYGSVNVQKCVRGLSDREKRVRELASQVFARGMQFMKSSPTLDCLPSYRQSYPEVCLAGPVNSGKSSILHAISGKSTIARASKKSGSTGTIRFCCVGDAFLISDTVGYGEFTKIRPHAHSQRLYAHALVRQYIATRVNVKKVYFVLDASRRDSCFTCRDKEYYAWLSSEDLPFTIVLSKIDALHPADLRELHHRIVQQSQAIDRDLGKNPSRSFLEISSRTGHGITRLMTDMVFSAASELPDPKLTLGDLQNLSYTPMSTTEQLNAEARYPPSIHDLPLSDDVPYPEWILGSRHSLWGSREESQGALPSFYFSLDKTTTAQITASNTPALTQMNPQLQNAIKNLYQRDKLYKDATQLPQSALQNIDAYLATIPGTHENYVKNFPEPANDLEHHLLGRSRLFDDPKKLSKNAIRRRILRNGFYQKSENKNLKVSCRLHFPFSRSSEGALGRSRLIHGLKQHDHSSTYGPATLQRRRR